MKSFILSLVAILLLDAVWLTLMSGFYKSQLGSLMRVNINWYAAGVTYVLIAIGISVLILPRVEGMSLLNSFLIGAVFGVVAYGLYDFTNLATINGWSAKLSLVDVVWGGVLNGLVVVAVKSVASKLF